MCLFLTVYAKISDSVYLSIFKTQQTREVSLSESGFAG
jgi:hypothetical protein